MAVVAILGLGLIGGSIALDLVCRHDLRGFDPDPHNRDLAARAGVRIADAPMAALEGAHLAILCAPLARLPGLLEAIGPHCAPTTVVTDVGGTKEPIVEAGRRHLPPGSFVGGHPMAGTTERGFAAARRGLFADAPWALTPEGPAEQASAARIRDLLGPTGARFLDMTARTHDAAVAFTSHLPYLVSVALARTAHGAQREGLSAVGDLLGPGFKDSTRLAMTPSQLGLDMALGNREALLGALAALRHQLAQAEILLQGSMTEALRTWTEGAAGWRATL